VLFAAATAALLHDESHVQSAAADPHSPWARADAWRIGHAGKRIIALAVGEQRHEVEARGHASTYQLQISDAKCTVEHTRWDGATLSARFDDEACRFAVRADASRVLLHDADGRRWRLDRAAAYAWAAKDAAGGNQVIAPMPGRIVLVKARPGDGVEEGQELLVMEAMKMELALKAPRAGTIESVSAAQGDFVEADAVLVRFAS
ncbi:MAG TPA: biotin/lipoyl-containing protein, partial [Rhodanobacter sp.]